MIQAIDNRGLAYLMIGDWKRGWDDYERALGNTEERKTPLSREALLQRATNKSKRQVEELIAEIVPRPDAPALMRKLPERRNGVTRALQLGPDDVAPLAPVGLDAAAPLAPLGPDGAAPHEPLGLDRPAAAVELRPDGVAGPAPERQPDRAAFLSTATRRLATPGPRCSSPSRRVASRSSSPLPPSFATSSSGSAASCAPPSPTATSPLCGCDAEIEILETVRVNLPDDGLD